MFLNLFIIDMIKTRGAFVPCGSETSSHAEASPSESLDIDL